MRVIHWSLLSRLFMGSKSIALLWVWCNYLSQQQMWKLQVIKSRQIYPRSAVGPDLITQDKNLNRFSRPGIDSIVSSAPPPLNSGASTLSSSSNGVPVETPVELEFPREAAQESQDHTREGKKDSFCNNKRIFTPSFQPQCFSEPPNNSLLISLRPS